MPKIVEISSYFSSKTNFKKAIANIECSFYPVLVDYLKQFAYKHSSDGLYKTYLFLTKDQKTTAYISFSITTIDGDDIKTYLDVPLGLNYPLPALKITRLLVSDEYKNRGIASELLNFAEILAFIISCQVGCKAIVVDSKKEAEGFYRKNGFDKCGKEYHTNNSSFMIKKVITVKEYKDEFLSVIEEFIKFCDDYSLDMFKAALNIVKYDKHFKD